MSADADGIKIFSNRLFPFFSFLSWLFVFSRRYGQCSREFEGTRFDWFLAGGLRGWIFVDWSLLYRRMRFVFEFTIRLEEERVVDSESNSSGYSSMRRSSSLPCLEKRGRLTPSSWRNVQEASRVERGGGTSGNDWPRSFYDFGRQMKILGAVRATSTPCTRIIREGGNLWRKNFRGFDYGRGLIQWMMVIDGFFPSLSSSLPYSRDENWNRSMIVWIFRDWRGKRGWYDSFDFRACFSSIINHMRRCLSLWIAGLINRCCGNWSLFCAKN